MGQTMIKFRVRLFELSFILSLFDIFQVIPILVLFLFQLSGLLDGVYANEASELWKDGFPLKIEKFMDV